MGSLKKHALPVVAWQNLHAAAVAVPFPQRHLEGEERMGRAPKGKSYVPFLEQSGARGGDAGDSHVQKFVTVRIVFLMSGHVRPTERHKLLEVDPSSNEPSHKAPTTTLTYPQSTHDST